MRRYVLLVALFLMASGISHGEGQLTCAWPAECGSDDAVTATRLVCPPGAAQCPAGNTVISSNGILELLTIDVGGDGTVEYKFGGADASIIPGMFIDTDGDGANELQLEKRSPGSENGLVLKGGLQIGNATGRTNRIDLTGGELFYDRDGDRARDATDGFLLCQLKTADPVDGTDGCAQGDCWLNTTGHKVFWCTTSGFPTGSDWWGVALADAP